MMELRSHHTFTHIRTEIPRTDQSAHLNEVGV